MLNLTNAVGQLAWKRGSIYDANMYATDKGGNTYILHLGSVTGKAKGSEARHIWEPMNETWAFESLTK